MATKNTFGAPLDPKVANKLLDLLSTDAKFRLLFKKNPLAALAEVGYPPAKEAIALQACLSVDQFIAPKREIAAAREQLKAYLTSTAIYTNPHCFDAGKIESTLRRK